MTPKQKAMYAYKFYKQFGSFTAAGKAANVSKDFIHKWYDVGVKQFGMTKIEQETMQTVDLPPAEALKVASDKRKEKTALDAATRLVTHLEEENTKLKQMLEIKDEVRGVEFEKIPTYKAGQGKAIACIIGSDWHAGERVDKTDVPGGRNEYNPTIFERRARSFFQRALYLTQSVSTGPKPLGEVDTLALFLLGDLITGWLHDDQRETNWLTPTEEFVLVYRVIAEGIDYLISEGKFKQIVVVTADGNHDRTTEKMRVKNQSKTSLSNMMYRMLKMHFDKVGTGVTTVTWHIAEGYTNYVTLGNTTIRAHHGDGFQYGGGIGGFDIPLNKAIPRWNTIKYADLDVFGHWHCLRNGSNYISNGSLIGHGAYSTKMVRASFEEPRQAFFVINPKRPGVAAFMPIYTEKAHEPE